MKKKLLSIAAACVLGVQAIAMPMIANAEQGTHYVENSDFNDVSWNHYGRFSMAFKG